MLRTSVEVRRGLVRRQHGFVAFEHESRKPSALARIDALLLAKSDPGLKRDSKLETPATTVVAN